MYDLQAPRRRRGTIGNRGQPRAVSSAHETDGFFSLSLELLCIRGIDGFFKRINPAFTEVLGYEAEELLARPIRHFMHPDDVARTDALIRSLTPGGTRRIFEDRWICADGSERTLKWSAVRGGDGMDVYAIARDVTLEQQREAELRQAKVMAEEANSAKRCAELGIASYLLRPLAPAELRDALSMTMRRGRAARERGELVTRHSLREARLNLEVLIAEDNRVNQRLVIHLLERFGHACRLATTGLEVLQAYAEESFDVILMDIQMPDMDGIEATSRIREQEVTNGTYTPIVAMTARAMVRDRERFIGAGMDDYISKPISRDRLRAVLRRLGPGAEVREAPARPAPAAGGPTTSFDRAALMERTDSDSGLIRTLVGIFETVRPRLLVEIQSAIERDDAEALHRAAHTLKGALGAFGARAAYSLAERLERLGRDGSPAHAKEDYLELSTLVSDLEDDLRRLVEKLG